MTHDLRERLLAILREIKAEGPASMAAAMVAIAEEFRAIPRGPSREFLLAGTRNEPAVPPIFSPEPKP